MKRIRIGNTIQLRWAIYEKTAGNPVPYNLSGRVLKVYLQGLFKPDIEITDFGVSDNVLSVTFEGKDQKVLGGYTLLLIENPDDYSMRAVDFVKAFELVPHTVNDEDVEPVNNLEVVALDLDTTVDFGSGGGSITIDSQLSTTSRNAVQNRVVTAAINAKQNTIEDLEQIREGASIGATAIQPEDLAKVAKSGSYSDLKDKPSIPSAVTEETVKGWGFTKNKGDYIKPETGIPASDLEDDVQGLLDKATELNVSAVDTSEEVEEPDISYVTKQELDNAIASAITTTLNTEV